MVNQSNLNHLGLVGDRLSALHSKPVWRVEVTRILSGWRSFDQHSLQDTLVVLEFSKSIDLKVQIVKSDEVCFPPEWCESQTVEMFEAIFPTRNISA